MDAEIRAALRAMREPGALESIPLEAMLEVAREAMRRPEAPALLAGAIAELLPRCVPASPAPWGREASPIFDSMDIGVLRESMDIGVLRELYGALQTICWAKERAERDAAAASAQAADAARFAAEPVATLGQSAVRDWRPILARLHMVSGSTYLRVPCAARDVGSLRAAVKRRRRELSVRMAENNVEALVFRPGGET